MIRWIGFIVAIALFCGAIRGAEISFDFTLRKPAATSAGVYAADGTLVRVLWTMEKLDAGKFTRQWDGKDDFGRAAPAGDYTYKIVANRGTYTNVGAIGNSGLPPDAKNHTPTYMAAVAVDDEGSIYTANGWDEAGADFKKWDSNGKSVFDANFQIRNGKPNGAPYSIAVDDKYIYCGVGGWARAPWNEAQQIQRLRRSDGKEEKFTKTGREDGHIQVYEWPSRMIPKGTPQADADLMKTPLRSILVSGDTLTVADAFGWLREFNKVTGEPILPAGLAQPGLGVDRVTALAAGGSGGLWYGNAHHHVALLELQKSDNDQRQPGLFNIGQVEGIALDQKGRLYIADGKAGQLKIYAVDKDPVAPRLIDSVGHKANSGDRAADHFFHLTGVAVDKAGNIITIQNEPYGGARLAKFSPDGKLIWEHFACEFVSLGNYSVDDPRSFYSMTFHHYKLLDHNAGKWEYAANCSPFPTRRYYGDVHGVPRVIRFGDRTFYFLPTGDGVQVYRIDSPQPYVGPEGDSFHLVSLFGGRSPAPDGAKESEQLAQWTWHDIDTSGIPKPEQIHWFKKPGEGHYSCFGMDVDAKGNIVFADTSTHSIWTVPLGPPHATSDPDYEWTDAREIIPRDTSNLKFEPNMVQRADDGSYYAFGWSAAWPQPKNNPFWMGGTTLVRFDKTGRRLWAVKLPNLCVGLDTIPGSPGGCMVGEGRDARIDHCTADGLLIGTMKPGDAMASQSGWLDNHASVAVNRDPRDKVIDVFTEDDLVQRIGWYRVDDHDAETISGRIVLR